MVLLKLQPRDTLFFRDGRPFNQGESPFAPSLFPPSPQTVVGAVRAAWAKQLGWPGHGGWGQEIRDRLGGDGETLEGIGFKGPLLQRGSEPLFPVPAMLLGESPGSRHSPPRQLLRLRPSTPRFHCDMGDNISLPVPEREDGVEGRKLVQGWWLTRAGFQQILAGKTPGGEHFVAEESLWRAEPRIGITLDPETGTTREAALYATSHIRLAEGVSLVMEVDNPPLEGNHDWPVVLGGESRSAWMDTVRNAKLDVPAVPLGEATEGRIRYTAIVLTPLDPGGPPRAGEPFPGLPGRLTTTCMPRPQRWGGWDSIRWQPQGMRPHLAPGSVLFMEADERDREAIKRLHNTTIGRRASWGFGLIAIGIWK